MLVQDGTVEHLAHLLGFIQSKEYKKESATEVSGLVKKFKTHSQVQKQKQIPELNYRIKAAIKESNESSKYELRNFVMESEKLKWAGIDFGHHVTQNIQATLRTIGKREHVKEIRFWGKISGAQKNYYIIQGVKEPEKNHDPIPLGAQKSGEGVNYYSYWASNDPLSEQWTLLPDITPEHIKVAQKIKKVFKGNLNESVNSEPSFPGQQKHYLKAQLCRMSHSLELCPNGVYKVHEENPKLIEGDDEGKIGEFSEMSSLEGWKHKNQMILKLARCSHFIDPSLSEDDMMALTDKLNNEDAEVERLRPITDDKPPENSPLGVDNIWTLKVVGDSQVFVKEESNLVYGVVVLKNVYWPGWVTVGYKNGYCNLYVGDGLKSTQAAWHEFTNPDQQQDAEEQTEYPEPYPQQVAQVKEQAPEEEVNE